jgi:cytochrome c-type biogenesis protein CcmE
VELTPRTAAADESETARGRGRRSPWAYGALLLVTAGLGVVVWQGLTSASLYFYNADEAVEQRSELGDRRFRLQGTVLGDSIDADGDALAFTVAFDGARVDVHHDGDPPELFQAGIPVVLEGRWSDGGDVFESDAILVKHSEEYEADNGERLDEAEAGSEGSSVGDARTSSAEP